MKRIPKLNFRDKRLDIMEEKICEFEDISIKTIQNKTQRKHTHT